MGPHSAAHQVLSTPELLEPILLSLLDRLHTLSDREDPRSVRTHHNARVLLALLSIRQVSCHFNALITTSIHLRRALFLSSHQPAGRSWDCGSGSGQVGNLPVALRSYYRSPATQVSPILNPIVQTAFPGYHFRFWHLSLEASGNRYCAYLIITRKDMERYQAITSAHSRMVQRMFLSQPPIEALDASIWDERDETKEYIGRTTELADPRIGSEGGGGLTVNEVHRRVGEMFEQHRDLAAIKLTTV